MEQTSLITRIIASHRLVHDEPGLKPSVRIRVECQTEAGPIAVLMSPVAANELARQLRDLRVKAK